MQTAVTAELTAILELRPATAPDLVCTILEHGDNDGARLVASFDIDLPEPAIVRGVNGYRDVGLPVEDLVHAAGRVARELGDDAAGPEHVIIAVVDDERLAAEHHGLFRILGLQPVQVREQLRRLRANESPLVLLDPEPDQEYLARAERELYRLAELGRSD